MHYEQIKDYNAPAFKRLTGVRRETFEAMTSALRQAQPPGGRPCTLSLHDQLLLTLMYWREYRTQFHIAGTYGVSEATVSRTIAKIENALLASGQFRLPGKKALRPAECSYEVIVLDATECPVERPQKNSAATTVARKSATPRKRK